MIASIADPSLTREMTSQPKVLLQLKNRFSELYVHEKMFQANARRHLQRQILLSEKENVQLPSPDLMYFPFGVGAGGAFLALGNTALLPVT